MKRDRSTTEPREIPRFVPDEPFPPYSYVTGRFPHPTGDPAGHSFGCAPEHPAFGRAGTTGNFLKGLIHMAAAGVKARERRPQGIQRHAIRATELLHQTASEVGPGHRRYMGWR